MSFKLDMNTDITEIVLYNLRKTLSKNEQFSEELLKKIPQALAKFNTQLLTLKEQLNVVQQGEMKRSKQEIARQDYRRVMLIREENKLKIDPLNEKIAELNAFVSEIKDGLKTDKINTRKKAEQEAAAKLEKAKTQYAREVGDINGYREPVNLIKAVHDLFTSLHGHTLEDKTQILLGMPEKAERLQRQYDEFKANGNAGDLLKPPTVNKELLTTIGFTRERVKGILGYDPQTWKLTFDGYGERGHLIERINAKKRVFMRKKEAKIRMERENQAARKQLIEEGLIEK